MKKPITKEQVIKTIANYAKDREYSFNEAVKSLIFTGFCQPKFYKASVWSRVRKIMDYAVSLNIGVEYRPRRGAGHYWTDDNKDISIPDVVNLVSLELTK